MNKNKNTIHEVAILGATGTVGQKAIALLACEGRFKITQLVASEGRCGQRYGDAVDWREPLCTLDPRVADLRLIGFNEVTAPFVISALPTGVAFIEEPKLAQRGLHVFSNASAFRMEPSTPLLIPQINLAHLKLIERQKTPGKIVTNPNCATVFLSCGLAPLLKLGTLEHLSVVTLQSTSGAGYPGVSSMDILGNLIPYIQDEEEKIAEETKRILGTLDAGAQFSITTHVHRVPVLYGHTIAMHLYYREAVSVESAREQFDEWNKIYPGFYVIHEDNRRPQPLRDVTHDDHRVHIGRLKIGDKPNILGLIAMGNNLVLGAAGAAIANMKAFLTEREGSR
ncbi:aspartate-semialdehyde dehydrogenase [Opitutia bacterium SCGC AG-212-L18]|nr:aspartate-semialdehyde dehydrogenase [Opitutae bacterium SCGC AG-212-L18]